MAEQEELLNQAPAYAGDIVEADSSQVGTPLPSPLAPAPPL
jgi:hypothetical protein